MGFHHRGTETTKTKEMTRNFGSAGWHGVHVQHLIEMKEKTGRPQDIADVFYLRKIQEKWNNEG